ncbi:RDD family protein [Methanoregula sp.]|uniref:RDD family protein n=1 Tax=Methanoregula sp. TaxID=2052170 RepID=UPI00237332D8|nr:RDD family protein [Methanoregula sp.]MDD1685736.1 RDD family protein [Methanoregula sp.]
MADESPVPGPVAEQAGDLVTPPVPAPVASTEPDAVKDERGRTLYLAKWTTRFWAWIIDFCMVILFLNIVRGIFASTGWEIPLYIDFRYWEPFEFGFQSLIFFAYWTIMEGFQGRGQSIGKMVMNLKVVNRDGTKIRYTSAALESFGKAFVLLLPLDCLIGWLAMPGTKLRMFNRLSNTIVIKTDYKEPAGIQYVKDKE